MSTWTADGRLRTRIDILGYTVVHLDEHDRDVLWERFDVDGGLFSREVVAQREWKHGREIEHVRTTADGEVTRHWLCRYDEWDRLVDYIRYHPDGAVRDRQVYDHSPDDWSLRYAKWRGDGSVMEDWTVPIEITIPPGAKGVRFRS